MNLSRIGLAALGAFVAYFVLGGLSFALFPPLRNEFLKYPAVYRPKEGQMSHMPVGVAAMFLAILALAVIYALLCHDSSIVAAGARSGALFGALIGVFAIGSFVVHNYVNLNIGLKLTLQVACERFFYRLQDLTQNELRLIEEFFGKHPSESPKAMQKQFMATYLFPTG